MDTDRRYGPNWFGVVTLLEQDARRRHDGMSLGFAELMGEIVEDHYNCLAGCDECSEGYAALDCPRWDDAQSLMIGWLIGKAAS